MQAPQVVVCANVQLLLRFALDFSKDLFATFVIPQTGENICIKTCRRESCQRSNHVSVHKYNRIFLPLKFLRKNGAAQHHSSAGRHGTSARFICGSRPVYAPCVLPCSVGVNTNAINPVRPALECGEPTIGATRRRHENTLQVCTCRVRGDQGTHSRRTGCLAGVIRTCSRKPPLCEPIEVPCSSVATRRSTRCACCHARCVPLRHCRRPGCR